MVGADYFRGHLAVRKTTREGTAAFGTKKPDAKSGFFSSEQAYYSIARLGIMPSTSSTSAAMATVNFSI